MPILVRILITWVIPTVASTIVSTLTRWIMDKVRHDVHP